MLLGLLRGRARARFEVLLPAHPVLRSAAQTWQQRLAPLTASVGLQAPPARVWQRIEATLFGGAAAAVGQEASAAGSWWRRPLVFWRGLSAASVAAAVFLGVQLAYPPARAPVVVVLSSASDAAPAFVASFNADGRAVVTRPLQPVSMQPGRSLELWAVPAQGAPRSLGLISAQGASVVQRGRVAGRHRCAGRHARAGRRITDGRADGAGRLQWQAHALKRCLKGIPEPLKGATADTFRRLAVASQWPPPACSPGFRR